MLADMNWKLWCTAALCNHSLVQGAGALET
jgi:hypothetical protein